MKASVTSVKMPKKGTNKAAKAMPAGNSKVGGTSTPAGAKKGMSKPAMGKGEVCGNKMGK